MRCGYIGRGREHKEEIGGVLLRHRREVDNAV